MSVSNMRDEFRGQGGLYLLDPETGERVLLERTQPHEQPTEVTNGREADQEVPDSEQD